MNIALNQLFDLTGRVAVVTGGSRGLGLQIATALGESGAELVLLARKRSELDLAVGALGSMGIKAIAFDVDLSRVDSTSEVPDRIMQRTERIDILVNNAGTTWGAKAEDYPIDGWNKVISLSLTATFALTKHVAQRAFFPQKHGVVLNIASTEGLLGHHHSRLGTVAYNAAKGGVISMTRALAAEWGPHNIRVNALAPGFFTSKMTAATVQQYGDEMISQTPLGKLGGSNDLKGAALLLSSDAGGHITGQTIVVDGDASII